VGLSCQSCFIKYLLKINKNSQNNFIPNPYSYFKQEIKHSAMQETILIRTGHHNGLYDITEPVKSIVTASGIITGLVNVYVQGATAAIMIQENWDESVQNDVVSLLQKLVPGGVWQHDHQDNNGDAHLKSGLVGPSETIPIIGGKIGLSTWQNIFLCEFDGPRQERRVVVTVFDCERK
jgi:secondary thiamine-phosphate synthase enzyme